MGVSKLSGGWHSVVIRLANRREARMWLQRNGGRMRPWDGVSPGVGWTYDQSWAHYPPGEFWEFKIQDADLAMRFKLTWS
jgi:hypothetical protein